MSILIGCLFVGALLPIVLAWVAGYHRVKQFGKIDNKNPRAQYAELEGVGARAVAAQKNAWEALAIFVAGIVAQVVRGEESEAVAILALVWLGARILHAVFYLANLDALRSLAFLVGTVCALALFFV